MGIFVRDNIGDINIGSKSSDVSGKTVHSSNIEISNIERGNSDFTSESNISSSVDFGDLFNEKASGSEVASSSMTNGSTNIEGTNQSGTNTTQQGMTNDKVNENNSNQQTGNAQSASLSNGKNEENNTSQSTGTASSQGTTSSGNQGSSTGQTGGSATGASTSSGKGPSGTTGGTGGKASTSSMSGGQTGNGQGGHGGHQAAGVDVKTSTVNANTRPTAMASGGAAAQTGTTVSQKTVTASEVETNASKAEANTGGIIGKAVRWFVKEVINVIDVIESTKTVIATSVLSAVGNIVEAVVIDGLVGYVIAGVLDLCGADDYANDLRKFAARDLVGEANKWFYEENDIGRHINEMSAIKYDSAVAKGITTFTETAVKIAAATAISTVPGGIFILAGIGALEGMGNAAESAYQNALANGETDLTLSVLSNLGILGSGALDAVAWIFNAKLGQGLLNIAGDIGELGIKEAGTTILKQIFSKETLSNALKPSNLLMNLGQSGLQSGGKIGPIFSKIVNGEEITLAEWGDLAFTFGLYFLINTVEDSMREYVTAYESGGNINFGKSNLTAAEASDYQAGETGPIDGTTSLPQSGRGDVPSSSEFIDEPNGIPNNYEEAEREYRIASQKLEDAFKSGASEEELGALEEVRDIAKHNYEDAKVLKSFDDQLEAAEREYRIASQKLEDAFKSGASEEEIGALEEARDIAKHNYEHTKVNHPAYISPDFVEMGGMETFDPGTARASDYSAVGSTGATSAADFDPFDTGAVRAPDYTSVGSTVAAEAAGKETFDGVKRMDDSLADTASFSFKSLFKGADEDSSARSGGFFSKASQFTKEQQQWIKDVNKLISKGEQVNINLKYTNQITSSMLEQIDDLSKVTIRMDLPLSDFNGNFMAKYNKAKYFQRITYSGQETYFILQKLEEFQSKVNMDLPISLRARQIYELISDEIPVLRRPGGNYSPEEWLTIQSYRGITSNNIIGEQGLVCAGYATVFRDLCYRCGIDCDYVRGKACEDLLTGKPGGHAWNVFIDELGNAIPVDVTWRACGAGEWFGGGEKWLNTHLADADEIFRDYSVNAATTNYQETQGILDMMIKTMDAKFGEGQGLLRLSKYLETNDSSIITGDKGLRACLKWLNNEDIADFIRRNQPNIPTIPINKSISNIVTTMDKYYGKGNGIAGLYKYLMYGDASGITHQEGARDLMKSLSKADIQSYLDTRMDSIKQIIDITNKYYDNTGFKRLSEYIRTGDAHFITSKEGARNLLKTIPINELEYFVDYMKRIGWE